MNAMSGEYETKTGLGNMGNTCFMNSALQILTHCDELTQFMLSHNFTNKLSQVYRQYLMEYNSSKSHFSPHKLKSTMGHQYRLFNGYSQQDSHEFMINFLDYLEEDLKKENIPDDMKEIVSNLFDCRMKTIIRSTESKEKSTKEDPVRFLQVAIPNKTQITLEDCLMQFIGKEEMGEDGTGLWETPSKKREKAIKMNIILKFPKYLIFQVKRYSFKQGYGKKISTDIKVKEKWESALFPENSFYELKGFIYQSGGLGGGHYVSYVKIQGEWFCFNDSYVNRINHDAAMKVATKSYLLFYAHRLNTDTVYINGELDSDDETSDQLKEVNEYINDANNANNSNNSNNLNNANYGIFDNDSYFGYMNTRGLSKKERRDIKKKQQEENKKKKKRKIYVLTGGKH